MEFRIIYSMLLLTLWPTMAISEVASPVEGTMGLYFDRNGVEQFNYDEPFAVVHAYLIIKDSTFQELYGWEAAVRSVDGELFLADAMAEGDVVADWEGGGYRATYNSPVPGQQVIVLATYEYWSFHYDECLYVRGLSSPSIPEERPLVWVEPQTPSAIEPAMVFSNGVGAVMSSSVALIGVPFVCEQVVGAEEVTWGALKATYR